MNEQTAKGLVESLLNHALKIAPPVTKNPIDIPIKSEQNEIVLRLISIQAFLVNGVTLDLATRNDVNGLLDQLTSVLERLNVERRN